MVVLYELAFIVFLTLLNAFFAGAEIAILSVRKSRLRELAAEGHGGAAVALRLREDPERFLATVQVGITVVGTTAGAFGGAVLEEPIGAALRRVGLGDSAMNVAFVLVVVLVSMLSIVIGELVPKSLALRSAERAALWVSRPLYILSRIARPAIWFLTAASNVLLRPFRDTTTFTETRLSREELQHLLEEATTVGTVDKETGDIASRAIDLGALRAYSVMVPRNEVAWLTPDATRARVLCLLHEQPHARYPVLDETGQPMGYVLAREVYAQLLGDKLDIPSLIREVPVLYEQTRAVDALRTLQRGRSEIGVVVEEHGAIAGLVSIESLAEELFGEIVAEHETTRTSIVPGPDGSFVVRGETPLHEVNRELGLDLPIDATSSTLGGLVVASCGGFPATGTRLVLPGGIEAEVVLAASQRVVSVRLTPRPPARTLT
jgi:putative hemolysin